MWGSALSIFNMFKNNINSSYLDIDDRSWEAYNTFINADWEIFTFDVTRMFYLFFLQDLIKKNVSTPLSRMYFKDQIYEFEETVNYYQSSG